MIGLTGNIACGKSTVLALLAECGADTIDADREVHALYNPGSPVTAAIAAEFGAGVLAADGVVDRRALGAIVLGDPARLRALETIVHPAVRRQIEARIAASTAPVLVIDAIKLIEGGLADRCDSVWVVMCQPEVQLARLMARDGAGRADAERRIAAQPPASDKIARADVVIDNSGTRAATTEQVARAWTEWVVPRRQGRGRTKPRIDTKERD
ncbi:MAG: dephospho-CoA kinase [Chloroflexi bacterium]|nr:dephospho-CoA kinase [Chloroflexota bacterium]